ncbi:hypothetical protein Hanom_Chr15g01395901 [Helianthus anomalus]
MWKHSVLHNLRILGCLYKRRYCIQYNHREDYRDTIPPVPPTSIYEGVLASVQDSLQMIIMITSGGTKKSGDLWTLNDDRWYGVFSTPPVTRIPFSTWVTFTHFMTNGMWYLMSGPRKLYEFPT